MSSSNGHDDDPIDPDSFSHTSYNPYPAQRPFINDEYRPAAASYVRSVDSLPESNRQALLSAMKKLQDKIHRLDIERSTAESHLTVLAGADDRYRNAVRNDMAEQATAQDQIRRTTNDIQSHLTNAGSRVSLLEKRLDDMRQIVEDTEEKVIGARHGTAERVSDEQLRKISELEKEHNKFSTTQSIAQDKIKELEQKLNLERLRRTLRENNNDDPVTPKLVDFDICNLKSGRKQKVTKKKRRERPSTSTYPHGKAAPGQHYRVKLSDIPFVAGTATTPSHSLGANVQRVISMMKSHNDAMCAHGSANNPAQGNITDVLSQLQREFNELSQEHDTLLSQMNTPRHSSEALQSQLEALIARMEVKSEQIRKLSLLKKSQKAVVPRGTTKRRPHSAPTTPAHTTVMTSTTKKPSEVRVTTTIRTKSSGLSVVRGAKNDRSLNTLKYMKKLQTTLRPNDLSWE